MKLPGQGQSHGLSGGDAAAITGLSMPSSPHPDGLPTPQRHWSAATIGLGISMSVLDGVIANVALPVMARDLGVTPSSSIWIVNAYQLMVLVAILPLASLGDIIGYRRVHLGGVALFTFASVLCALSPNLPILALSRALQGLGAAGMMSVSPALLRFTYPHALLGRGIGINSLVVAASAGLGPSLAAAILSIGPWPLLFAINLPIGLAAIAVGRKALPFTPRGSHAFDWKSTVLIAAVATAIFWSIEGLAVNASAMMILALLGSAVVLGVLLVRLQRQESHPMLPVDLLAIPIFSLSVGASIAAFCGYTFAMTALPFRLFHVFGFSVGTIGLMMTTWPVSSGLASVVAGRLSERYPAGILGGIGMALFGVSLLALAALPLHASGWAISACMAMSGAGFGLFQSPNNRNIIASAPRHRSGGAGGMLAMARLAGMTLGAAAVSVLLAWYANEGTWYALVLGTGFAALAAVLSMLRLSSPAPAAANVALATAKESEPG